MTQETEPLTAAQYNRQGMVFIQDEQWGEALEVFTKALELDPAFREASYNRSAMYRRLGRDMEAEADMKKYSTPK